MADQSHYTFFVPGHDDDPRVPPLATAGRVSARRLAVLALLGAGLLGAIGWTAFRLLDSGVASRALATLTGNGDVAAAGTAPPGPARAPAAGDSAAADTAAAPAADSGDSARARLAAADSAAALEPPHPANLVGRWHHGDSRSRYGDSLTLVLAPDGSATGHERRYGLDRTGWHPTRVEREGHWYVRYGGRRSPQLCTAWKTPQELGACSPMVVDTVATGRILQFAGRHWRQESTDAAVTSADDTPRRARPAPAGPGRG